MEEEEDAVVMEEDAVVMEDAVEEEEAVRPRSRALVRDDGHFNGLARGERDNEILAFHAVIAPAGSNGDGARALWALERQFACYVPSRACSLAFCRLEAPFLKRWRPKGGSNGNGGGQDIEGITNEGGVLLRVLQRTAHRCAPWVCRHRRPHCLLCPLGDDFGGFGLERATRQEDAEPCAYDAAGNDQPAIFLVKALL